MRALWARVHTTRIVKLLTNDKGNLLFIKFVSSGKKGTENAMFYQMKQTNVSCQNHPYIVNAEPGVSKFYYSCGDITTAAVKLA